MSKSKAPPAFEDTKQSYADKPLDPEPKDPSATRQGDGSTSGTGAKQPPGERLPAADVKSEGTDATSFLGTQNISGELLGNPATGSPVTKATGEPRPAGTTPSLDVLDPSKTDAASVLDRLVAEHAAVTTPEIHKTALRKADEMREHAATATYGSADAFPSDMARVPSREADDGYADFREVTVKLGAPGEADFVEEGATVSHVNAASGELTFRVAKGGKAFDSVRARQIVKGG